MRGALIYKAPDGSSPTTCLLLQDVAEALRRVPMDVIVERNCRLKRALILSLKKTELSEELQAKQTPFLQYLQVCTVY